MPQKALNILFVQEAPSLRSHRMATALRGRGHLVTLAYTKTAPSQSHPGLDDEVYLQCVKLASYRQLWDLSASFDLVHCHNEPDVLTVAALAGPAPVVHDTHDLISLRSGGDAQLVFFEGAANRGAQGRVYTSDEQAGEAAAMYGAEGPTLVLRNLVSRTELPGDTLPKLSAGDGRTHLVYHGEVGGLPHLDFAGLFSELAGLGFQVHVYPLQFDSIAAETFGRMPNVHYCEPLGAREVIAQMTQFDLGIIPFNVEKGNRRYLDTDLAGQVFEYFAAGLPVLAPALKSYRAFLEQEKAGAVFQDAREMAAKAPELSRLGRESDLKAKASTYEDEAPRLEELYARVISGRRARASSGSPATAQEKAPPAPRATANWPVEVPLAADGARQAVEALVGWLDSNGWDGWDPYDLQDFLIQRAKQGDPVGRERAQALQKRDQSDPLGLRRELGLQPKRIAKGLGLLAAGRVRLYQVTGQEAHLAEARALGDWLLNNPSPGYENLCWGYPFDWQSVVFIPKHTPSSVVSTSVGYGLWELYKLTREEPYLEACRSICRFIAQDLNLDDMGDAGICFSYTPIDDYHVHNANLFCAEFLARVGREAEQEEWLELARRAAGYALSEQNPDGSIFYWGKVQNQYAPDKLDHYHSGFELRCLFHLSRHLASHEIAHAFERYLEFYLANFLTPDGQPKLTPTRPYPINIHAAAEAVLLLSTVARVREEALELAQRTLEWTVANMQTGQGWFSYLWVPGARLDIPMLRWGQAWMLRAMAEYLAARERAQGNWGCRDELGQAPGRKAPLCAGRPKEETLDELWKLARQYHALSAGDVPGFIVGLAAEGLGLDPKKEGQRILSAMLQGGDWRTLAQPAPAPAAQPAPAPAAQPAPAPRPGPEQGPAGRRARAGSAAAPQIVMPPTQDAAYGSRSWADQLFAGTETDPWGHDWRASQLARYQAALGLLRQHVAPDKVGSLLDIGCALGHFTRQLSQSFAPARVLGVDISPQAVAKCRRLHPDMDFAESALPQMPLPREGFDLVCALEVIYYVGAENIAASLERIKGVMKPGGWLLVSTYLNKPPFNTAKAFEQALAPHFRIMETALRHHGLYNQFEGLARQAMGKWLEVKQLGVPGAAEQVDRFVGAGVELLGNLDLMEALNRYGAAKMPEQSLSHAIVVARRDG